MGFVEAINSGFRNYVNFRDRAPRSEYWYWTLFVVIVSIVAAIVDVALFRTDGGFGPLQAIVGLAFLLPGLGMVVRRLHDGDRSGWWILLMLIPLIGPIILLVWFCTRGTMGPNRFGPDPLEGKA